MVMNRAQDFVDQEGVAGHQGAAARAGIEAGFELGPTAREKILTQRKRFAARAALAGAPRARRQRRVECGAVDNIALPSGLRHGLRLIRPII